MLDDLVRSWRVAEQKLYPLCLVDPEGYERLVRAVRAVADELAGIGTPEQLVEAYDGRATWTARVVRTAAGRDDPATVDLVADSGFALRYAELSRELREAAVRDRIAAAGERPQWIVLHADGELREDGPAVYRRLEMHVPDGTALALSAGLDPETGLTAYRLEAFHLDPRTGQVAAAPAGEHLPPPSSYSDIDEWRAAAAALRQYYGPGDPVEPSS